MVIWMMPWWDSLVIGGSGSLVFGPSAWSELKWNNLTQVGCIDVFSQKLFDPMHFQWMKRWTFEPSLDRSASNNMDHPGKFTIPGSHGALQLVGQFVWGTRVSCGCGRWGSHATFPSQAWNVLWSGRVWCFLSVLVGTGVCRITAPQVMRCVSWEGSTRRIELTQQTPKISSQSPLQGISFFEICSCTFLFSTSPTQRTLSLSAWWLSWPCQMRLGFCLDLADLIRYRRHAMPINSNRPQTIKLYTRNFGRNLYPHFTAVKWTSPTYKQIYVFSSPRVFPVQKVSLHATHSTSFQVDRLWSADQCAEHLGEHSSLGWAGGDGGYL